MTAGQGMSDMKPRLRFKLQPAEMGRGRNYYGAVRGYDLWYGDQQLGAVRAVTGAWPSRDVTGYYWRASTNEALGIELMSTASQPVGTVDEAKAKLRAYVEAALRAKGLR